MVGVKSGLVSTVCTCTNDYGNLLRMSLIMDKLHIVVMRRNNQTRHTAVLTPQLLRLGTWSIIRATRSDMTRTCYNHWWFHHHCVCSFKQTAESRSRWTSQILWVATGIHLYHCRYIWSYPAALLSTWNLPFQYKEQTWALYQSPHFYLHFLWDKLETGVLHSYTVKINDLSIVVYDTPWNSGDFRACASSGYQATFPFDHVAWFQG